MKIFGLFKRRSSLKRDVNNINGCSLEVVNNKLSIVISEAATKEDITNLVEVMYLHKTTFEFHDSLYPTISDPGAYMSYSQEKNDMKNCWSMTMGNHGWSGGIYSINNETVVNQIHSLINKGLISKITIEGASIFSHYKKSDFEKNEDIVSKIIQVHNSESLLNVDSLIFGHFISESLSPYSIYNLTHNELYFDSSESWHSDRHSQNGYKFKGERMPEEKFTQVRSILNEIPSEILHNKWQPFYTTGNKIENKIILKVAGNSGGYCKEFVYDKSFPSPSTLTKEMEYFINNIERTIEKLKEKSS